MAESAGADGDKTGDRALMEYRARFACVSWSMLKSCGLRIELPCSRSRADVGFGRRFSACAPLVSVSRTPLVSRAALTLSRPRVGSAESNAALDNDVVDRYPILTLPCALQSCIRPRPAVCCSSRILGVPKPLRGAGQCGQHATHRMLNEPMRRGWSRVPWARGRTRRSLKPPGENRERKASCCARWYSFPLLMSCRSPSSTLAPTESLAAPPSSCVQHSCWRVSRPRPVFDVP